MVRKIIRNMSVNYAAKEGIKTQALLKPKIIKLFEMRTDQILNSLSYGI